MKVHLIGRRFDLGVFPVQIGKFELVGAGKIWGWREGGREGGRENKSLFR